jgi:ribosomal protein L37AE/L43A
MAEHGLLCATCDRQTLHRQGEPSHVLWAILTLFSCGLFGIVWLLDSAKDRPWLCTQCGTAWVNPDQKPREPMSAATRKAVLGMVVFAAVVTIGSAIALMILFRR